jgi:hypothetical protein
MSKRNTIAGLSGLLVAALLAVACNESLGPGSRGPGRPEFWGGGGRVATQLKFKVQPHPNPAQTTLPLCTAVPPLGGMPGSAFATDVEVQDAAGVPVNFTGDVTIEIFSANIPGTLCPMTTVTVHLVNQSVAHFVGLGIEQDPSPTTVGFYTFRATSSPSLTPDVSSPEFCINLTGDPAACAV